jgi:hypothetical protein
MMFDLEAYAQGVGMTGWNWYDQQSLWVAFDFDSIATHKGSGLTEQDKLWLHPHDGPWDTTQVPNGEYWLKTIASDIHGNQSVYLQKFTVKN